VLNYTLAYTAFAVKCLVAPEVLNNECSLAPITVCAPEQCLLNATRPRAVAARHTVGHMLPNVVFGCLHQVMENGVPAEGAPRCGSRRSVVAPTCSTSSGRRRGGRRPKSNHSARRSSTAAGPAERDHRVALAVDGTPDHAATARLRETKGERIRAL
jgi:hypothetical protein